MSSDSDSDSCESSGSSFEDSSTECSDTEEIIECKSNLLITGNGVKSLEKLIDVENNCYSKFIYYVFKFSNIFKIIFKKEIKSKVERSRSQELVKEKSVDIGGIIIILNYFHCNF